MRVLALLLLCTTVQALQLVKTSNDPDIENKLAANEREIDLWELDHFVPSKDLVKGWIAQLHKLQSSPKSFARQRFEDKQGRFHTDLTDSTIPNTCKNEVQNYHTKREECRDPWPMTQNCENAYEIPGYRLGDLYWEKYNDKAGPNSLKFYQEFFPQSIAAKYGNGTHKHGGDAAALVKIIDGGEYLLFEKPKTNDVVVHLRLGDKLTTYANHFSNMLKSDKFYRDIAEQLKESGRESTRVVLVTGDHYIMQNAAMNNKKGFSEKTKSLTLEYLDNVKKIFQEKGLDVKVRMNMNADCDVVYMANAPRFVPSGGGYDRLVKNLVNLKGGKVMQSHFK